MNEMINAYRSNSASGAEYSSPHQLITMLLDGAMERIARAIGHIERRETARKGECISRAVGIVDYLRSSLDGDMDGGRVSANLESLYDYMLQRLTEANLHNDVALLEEVRNLLGEVRGAWVSIPPEQRDPARAGIAGGAQS